MKTFQSNKAVSRIATLTAMVAAGIVLAPSLASADTAANTTLRNTVYVNYADASAVAQPQISDEVDVVVQLVVATPSLNSPTDQTIAPSSTAVYNYTITSNANGPDSYTASATVGTQNNLVGSTATLSTTVFSLGATSVAVAPGAIAANVATAIQVPSDTAIGGGVNGISAGEVVIIGGVRCDVTAISDLGPTLTGAIPNSSITVDCDAGINPAASALIAEQRSFTLTVDPNGWTAPSNGDVTVTTSAGDTANVEPDATHDTLTTVEQLLTVTKYVRNDSNPVVGAGPITVGANTYYASGVTGVPTDVLEYLIHVENTSTTNSATDVVISDAVPAFTTLITTSLSILDDTQTAIGTSDDTADNNNQGEVVSNTVYLYPGDTAANMGDDAASGGGNPNGDGGTIAPNSSAYGLFSVTVD